MYLLDTNVVSELRRAKPHSGVIAWLSDVRDDDIYLSVVTLGELQAGIEIARRQDPVRAQKIEAWVDQIAASYNVLAMDAQAFREWARLMHRRSDDLLLDAMIAATALVHRLTVVTRNVRDFRQLRVAVIDPFMTKPQSR